jgi:penicillin-binding protein 1A
MVVWNGYDDPETIGSRRYIGSYPYTATVVFRNVMKSIHSGLKKASFTKPNDIVNATICTVSGLVATDACKKDTRKVVKSEIFASGKVPTDKCTVHKLVEVCSVSKKLPTDYCHMYEDLKEISVITRSTKAKTSDSKYLMPTKTCTLHKTEPEPEVEEEQTPIIPETPIEPGTPVVPETPEIPGGTTGDSTGTDTGTETETPGVGGSIYE